MLDEGPTLGSVSQKIRPVNKVTLAPLVIERSGEDFCDS